MARVPKTPKEKKELSLKRDTRNAFGENAKASRKNIPLAKQRSHQAVRRAGRAPLQQALGVVDIEIQDEQESKALLAERRQELGSFRKRPDISLGTSLQRKLAKPERTFAKHYGRRPMD